MMKGKPVDPKLLRIQRNCNTRGIFASLRGLEIELGLELWKLNLELEL
jgi:hypothetical protein